MTSISASHKPASVATSAHTMVATANFLTVASSYSNRSKAPFIATPPFAIAVPCDFPRRIGLSRGRDERPAPSRTRSAASAFSRRGATVGADARPFRIAGVGPRPANPAGQRAPEFPLYELRQLLP